MNDFDYMNDASRKYNDESTREESFQMYRKLFEKGYNEHSIGEWLLGNDPIKENKPKVLDRLLEITTDENKKIEWKKIYYVEFLFNPILYKLNLNQIDNYQKNIQKIFEKKEHVIKNMNGFTYSIISNVNSIENIQYVFDEEEIKKKRIDNFNIKNKELKIAFLHLPIHSTPLFSSMIELFYYLSFINKNIIVYLDNNESDLNDYQKNRISGLKIKYIKNLNNNDLYHSMRIENIDILISIYGDYIRKEILERKPCKILIRAWDGEFMAPSYFMDYNLVNNIQYQKLKKYDLFKFIKIKNYMLVPKNTDFMLTYERPEYYDKNGKINIGLIMIDRKIDIKLVYIINKILKLKKIILNIYTVQDKNWYLKIFNNPKNLNILSYNNQTNQDLKKNILYLDTFYYNNNLTAMEILGSYRPIIAFYNNSKFLGMYTKGMIESLNMKEELSADNTDEYYHLVKTYISNEKTYYKMYDKFYENIEKSKIIDNEWNTKVFYNELLKIQLPKINEYQFENIPKEVLKNIDKNDNLEEYSCIPKIIHQIAPSNKNIWNDKWKHCYTTWKKYFPESEYKYILWNDDDDIDNFIKKEYPWFYNIYSNYDHKCKKIDAVRCFILLKYGGIYVDMDFECLSNFYNDIKDYSLSLSKSPFSSYELIQNSLMISKPNHIFWLYCINEMFKTKDKDLFNKTGPFFFDHIFSNYYNNINLLDTTIYNPHPNDFNHERVKSRHYCSHEWNTDLYDYYNFKIFILTNDLSENNNQKIEKLNNFHKKIHFELIKKINIDNILDIKKKLGKYSSNLTNDSKDLNNKLSNYLSHHKILYKLYKNKIPVFDYTIIIDDNYTIDEKNVFEELQNNLKDLIKNNVNFDILFMNTQTNEENKICKNIYKIDSNFNYHNNYGYIINNKNIKKIYKSLKDIKLSLDFNYYHLSILNKLESYSIHLFNIFNNDYTKIPKIFLQTSIKKPSDEYISLIKKNIPHDWEYKYFSDEDIIQFFKKYPLKEFPNIINVFNSFSRGAHKTDLFRYYFLYIFGGVFMDDDGMLLKNINLIIKDYEFFIPNSQFTKKYFNFFTSFNGFMGTVPKHPIIKEALLKIYNIKPILLDNDYFIIIKDLYNIVNNIKQKNNLNQIKIYEEASIYRDKAATINPDTNEIIFIHHFEKKVPIKEYENSFN